MEKPMTLKEYREKMQAMIDTGDRDGAKRALKILNDNGVAVQAIQESTDDKRDRIKSAVVFELREKKGIAPMVANKFFDANYEAKDSFFSVISRYH